MTFLLPRTVAARVVSARLVDIHGDRWVDVALEPAGEPPLTGRVAAGDCPHDLAPGETVDARIVLGSVVGVTRTSG